MSFRSFLSLMGLATVVAWAAWAFVLLRIDPFQAGAIGLVLFYLTLWVALVGTILCLGCLWRVVIRKRDFVFREVKTASRHAILLSILAVLCLFLSSNSWLKWWNVLAIVFLIGLVEYIGLLTMDRR